MYVKRDTNVTRMLHGCDTAVTQMLHGYDTDVWMQHVRDMDIRYM